MVSSTFVAPQTTTGAGSDPEELKRYQMDQERRQMAAKMLREQALTPLNPNRQIGNVAYRINPMEGLAKLAQGYLGGVMPQWQPTASQPDGGPLAPGPVPPAPGVAAAPQRPAVLSAEGISPSPSDVVDVFGSYA